MKSTALESWKYLNPEHIMERLFADRRRKEQLRLRKSRRIKALVRMVERR